MPRKEKPWTLVVQNDPELTENRPYAMRITAIEKSRKPHGIRVMLEHTSEEQLGRAHSVLFPLAVRSSGPVADLFRAAGMEISVGNTVAPKDAVGARILTRFRHDEDTGDLQPATFEPVTNNDGKTRNEDSLIDKNDIAVMNNDENNEKEMTNDRFALES